MPTGIAPFRYAERRPAGPLTPWLATYWEFVVREGAPAHHHVPPDGCTSLLFLLHGPQAGSLVLTGPWLEPLLVPVTPGSRYRGVRFRPGAVAAVLGVDPHQLLNTTIPADQFLGTLGPRLRALRVGDGTLDEAAVALDRCWSGERHRWPAPDPIVVAAAQRLVDTQGAEGIAELAISLGISDRTLRRRFVAATGLAPKQFARIRRLLAAGEHALTGAQRWGEIAAAAGYADQPHLHHDVVELTGLRPHAFGSRLRMTEHDQRDP